MGYKFHTDTTIEYPFCLEMLQQLGGKDSGIRFRGFPVFNGVQCPCCKKKKARFIVSDPDKGKKPYEQDTFVLQCPVDICDNHGTTTLHDVIKRFGSQSTLQRWREARYQKTYTDNWKGIKNRVPYEDRKPKKRRTFIDKLDVKTQTSFIRVTGESPDLGCLPINP